jgi:membrane protease YdiL (CAAX protease family)
LVIALVAFHILYLWPGEGLRGIGLTSRQFGSDFVLGAAVGLAQAALSLFVVIPALGDAANETLGSVKGLFESPERVAASLILVVVYGGIVEEMFFRGHIIRSVSHMLGNGAFAVAAAGVLSVALFAVAHRYQGEVGMLYAVGASSLYVALFLLTNRLTASMTAHAVYDAVTLGGIYALYGSSLGLPGS